MITLLDIAERTRKGPRMSEMDWNMGLYQKMNELAARYAITVPEDSWDRFYNDDQDLAGRALEAGIAFLAEMGAYCIQTERVVQFTEAQVREAIAEAPRQVVVGDGADARAIGQGHSPLPQAWGTGALHAPFEEEIAVDVARTFIETLGLDHIQTHNFQRLPGPRDLWRAPGGCRRQARRRPSARGRAPRRQAGHVHLLLPHKHRRCGAHRAHRPIHGTAPYRWGTLFHACPTSSSTWRC